MTSTIATPPRPTAPPIDFEAIPAELKALPQWVLWSFEWREPKDGKPGKWTKVPRRGSHNAKPNDPRTWGSYGPLVNVFRVLGKRNDWAGIGFVFAQGGAYVGVDLDDCRDPETGGIHPAAAKIIADLGTYCEVSPSGRGVKLWARGSLPTMATGTRRPAPGWPGEIEIYQHGRFFTVTGRRLEGTPAEINDAQAVVSAMWETIKPPPPKPGRPRPSANGHATNGQALNGHSLNGHAVFGPPDDAKVLAKIRASKQAAKFKSLWAGDLSAYRNDHSSADQALCNTLVWWCGPDVGRVDGLFRQSGLMRDKWDEVHHSDGRTYGAATIDKAIEAASEFYDWSKKSRKQRKPKLADEHYMQEDEMLPSVLFDEGQTETANVKRLIALHGDNIRFCSDWNSWLVWDGRRWAIDNTLQVELRAKGVPHLLWKQIATLAASGELKEEDLAAAVRFAKASSSDRGLRALLNQTKSESGVAIRPAELDVGRMLLNVQNGTLDLATGELQPHSRDDLITRLAPTIYAPAAPSPTWLAFLNTIFAGDADLIRYLQRLCGYWLTGDVREQILPIFWGTGANGKSTFVAALKKLLGLDYCISADRSIVVADDRKGSSTERMDLAGRRLAIVSETDDGQRFAEAFVKELTGGDAIRGRRVFENTWEFEPTHKVLLVTNHKPQVRATDHAFWRRVKLIRFGVTIADDQQDKLLPVKLAAESAGILAWAVQGCLAWQQDGLGEPKAVKDATQKYRAAEDVIGQYIAERCETGFGRISKTVLYANFHSWIEQNGFREISSTKFTQSLADRGFELDLGRRYYEKIEMRK